MARGCARSGSINISSMLVVLVLLLNTNTNPDTNNTNANSLVRWREAVQEAVLVAFVLGLVALVA